MVTVFLFTRMVAENHGSSFFTRRFFFFSYGESRTVTVFSFHTESRGWSRIFFFSLMATEK